MELKLRTVTGDLAPLRQERLPKLIQWGNPDRRISRVGKIGLAGRACHVVFWFYRGKLFAVDLGAAIRPLSIEDRWLWYEGVLGLLRQKYGPEENAAHEFGEIETRNAEWRNPPSIVKLIGARFFDADGVEHVDSTVKYFDPEQERLASGVDPADQSKL